MKTPKGHKALFELQVAKTTFTAEVGALLYDGVVVAIDDNSVTIRQTMGIPVRAWQASGSSEKRTRLVTRSLEGDRRKESRAETAMRRSGTDHPCDL